jgi:hypothetical protein
MQIMSHEKINFKPNFYEVVRRELKTMERQTGVSNRYMLVILLFWAVVGAAIVNMVEPVQSSAMTTFVRGLGWYLMVLMVPSALVVAALLAVEPDEPIKGLD